MRKIIVFLLLSVCLFPIITIVSASPEITAQPGQVDPYKTRSELLMDATKYTGSLTPEQAASVWAKGLEERSAAMQYIVMTDKLKKEYARQLDALSSNWVTGMSSPWVQSFSITNISKTDDSHTEIELKFEIMAVYFHICYDAKLWLVREGDFWRIERIWTAKELYPYTLYNP